MAVLKSRPPAEVALKDAEPAALASLVRKLASHAERMESTSAAAEEHVILDIEVEGLRCVLFQLPRKSEREHAVLSPREQEIARMVAKGYPNKTIASVLEISSWTVGTYLRRIFAKLRVSSRAAMVARLIEAGLLVTESR